MDLVNEKYCVFRITVDSAAVIPKPVWTREVRVIVAKNKQDALNVYDPAITGSYGAMHKVINCEEIGTIDYIVTDETKAEWKEEAKVWQEKTKNDSENMSEEDLQYILSHGTRVERPWTPEEIRLMDNIKPATAEETKEMADRLKELGKNRRKKYR